MRWGKKNGDDDWRWGEKNGNGIDGGWRWGEKKGDDGWRWGEKNVDGGRGSGNNKKLGRGERGGRHVRMASLIATAVSEGRLVVESMPAHQRAYIAWSQRMHAKAWRGVGSGVEL